MYKRQATVCAEEGTVKAGGSAPSVVTKKALCAEDTPIPTFVKPRPPKVEKPVLKPVDLPPKFDPFDSNGKIKFPIPPFGDDIKEQIRKNLEKTFPPIKFKFPFNSFGEIPERRPSVRPNVPPPVIKRPVIDFNELSKIKLGGSAGPRLPLPSRPAPRTSGGGGGFAPVGQLGGFGSGQIQNRFTPGNTFTGYRRGGY